MNTIPPLPILHSHNPSSFIGHVVPVAKLCGVTREELIAVVEVHGGPHLPGFYMKCRTTEILKALTAV